MSIRSLKRRSARLFYGRFHGKVMWRSQEEQAWLDIVPVGREFGSPDYERLMQQDLEELKLDLSSLVAQCREDSSEPIDADFFQEALNVQSALHELEHDVSVAVAAAVWRYYSKALMASWLSGAHTVASAKRTLLVNCTRQPAHWGSFFQSDVRTTDDFMEGIEDLPVQDRDTLDQVDKESGEDGSTNVYADLGYADADGMQRKSQLASEIARAIKARRLTMEGAAALLGIDLAALMRITRGQFRRVSEATLLEMLAKLS